MNTAWRAQVGPAYSQRDVARLLGVSPRSVRRNRRLLVLHPKDEHGRMRAVYPVLQFTGHRLRPEIGDVVQILRPVLTPEAIASWLTSPRPDLAGHTPSAALTIPEVAPRVLPLARRLAARLAEPPAEPSADMPSAPGTERPTTAKEG